MRRNMSFDLTEEQAAEMYAGAQTAQENGDDSVSYTIDFYPSMVMENLEATFPGIGESHDE